MKFGTVQIYFLSEFSACCHPNILLPWQRDETTSPLYPTIQNPSSIYKNWNPVAGIWNPRHGIQNPKLHVLDSFHGVKQQCTLYKANLGMVIDDSIM